MNRFKKIVATFGVLALLGAADAPHVSGQLLAYQGGFVFFTNGDGFKLAPSVKIVDDATKQPVKSTPRARMYARAVFNDQGQVTEIDLSKKAFALEPISPLVESYVVQASPSKPNPDLSGPVTPSVASNGALTRTFSGKPVLVTITVLVPPDTPRDAQVYIATDQSSWNPQAVQMDRVDALHFRVTRNLKSGTVLHYVYTRGTLQSSERAENGLTRDPHELIVNDADVRAINDVVYRWADQTPFGLNRIQPNVAPTPYNPAPFPNLPSGIPTPHP